MRSKFLFGAGGGEEEVGGWGVVTVKDDGSGMVGVGVAKEPLQKHLEIGGG